MEQEFKRRNYLIFPFRVDKGVLSVKLDSYTTDLEKIKMLVTWMGKGLAFQILLFILKRINSDFTKEKNGWLIQNKDTLKEIMSEMYIFKAHNWALVNE